MSKLTLKVKFLSAILLWSGCLVVSATVFRVMPLPYSYKALEPYLSRETLELHHDKHYRNYVNMLNIMLNDIERLDESSLEEVMLYSYQWNKPLYNNAAQSWNHDFYFKCMTSNYLPPSRSLVERISQDFGSFDRFTIEFRKAGNSAFGSGWAWLVYDGSTGKLFVTKTIGADNPIIQNENYRPILAMDVWEHAYYLDFQNKRKEYTEIYVKFLVDWKFVEENLLRAETTAAALAKQRAISQIEDEDAKRERERIEAEAVIEAAKLERLRIEAEAARIEQERVDAELAAEAVKIEQERHDIEAAEAAKQEEEELEPDLATNDEEGDEAQEL